MEQQVRLGDICQLINGGAWTEDKYADDGIPVVRVSDMKNGHVDLSGQKYLANSSYGRYKKNELYTGDLVIATVGSHATQLSSAAGRAIIIPTHIEGMLLNQNAVCIRTASSALDQKYLGYLGQSPNFSTYIREAGRGAANQMRIPLSAIRDYVFTLPNPSTQKRIASILSAYDDLIENNRRRIELLEQAARLLYREWFVHLRFPGHEHVRIVDGVPEGWEKMKIDDVCKTVGGGTPSTKVSDYWEGEITWVVPSDVTKNDSLVLLDSERKITEKGLRESSAKMVPPMTILMTSRASVGFFALMDSEVCTNQGFISIIPRDIQLRMYLLFNLMSRVKEIRSNAKGTTYPEISKGRFRDMDIVIPSKTLSIEFGKITTDIIQQVWCLKRSTNQLIKARDLLLPRLMNGEVVV